MAGLQITPVTPGISTPTAPTTRTGGPAAEGTTVDTVKNSATEIRTPAQREESAVDRAITENTEKERTDRTRETEQQRREDALENVVSVSDDGDTVQVSDEGAQELSESTSGAVISQRQSEAEALRDEEDIEIEPVEAPEIEPIEAPEITPVTTDTDDEKREITSFVGYTDQQVEQMYLKGEISQNDYNNEIARREELEASDRADKEQFNRDMGRLEEADSRTERADFAIENAIENGNERIGLDQRMQAVDDLFEGRQNEARRQEEAGRLWDYQLQV
ncbi:MAG: hypothetical protein K6B14_03980 [Lachnospiraceae bacterium]|nr:hypothetical protein [Lachnospiraceae bacterium]